MQIRKALLSDLPQLAALFDAYRIFYKKNSDLASAKKFLEARIQNNESEIFVCEEASNLKAFVQLYPLFSSTQMKRVWLLNDLFVSPDYRGKGASLTLIEAAKELCRKTSAAGMMLETDKTNIIGNSLYPRAGLELDKEHNFYSWTV